MTRTYTAKPVWTWKCDQCGREHELARNQSGPGGLSSMEQMRARGWFIAESFGDLCPPCNATTNETKETK